MSRKLSKDESSPFIQLSVILRTLKESHALGVLGETHSGLISHVAVEVKKVCRAQWTQQGASGSSSGLLQLPPDGN